MSDWAAAARRFVRGSEHGALATLSRRHGGYPFGSTVSFVPDALARPILLVSRLAEHSANLKADARASLLVQQPGADPQALSRVTLVCDAQDFEPEPRLVERHVRYHPPSARLLGLGDFSFVRLVPLAVRFIAGFGAIRWVDPADYLPRWPQDEAPGAGILATLHEQGEFQALCRERLGAAPADVELLGLDCDGIDVRVAGRRARLEFPETINDETQITDRLARLAT